MRSLIWRWWAFAKKRQIKNHAKLTSYTVLNFLVNLPWVVIKLQTTRILMPEQYNITKEYNTVLLKFIVLLKNHSFDIQKYGLKWNWPDGKINVILTFYFVLCRRAVLSRYTKPTVNLPWIGLKLQNYKNINTRAIQHYNRMQYSVVKFCLIKKSFFWYSKIWFKVE